MMSEDINKTDCSDALFRCVYHWIHAHPIRQTDAEQAIREHLPDTAQGALAIRMCSIAKAEPGWLVDNGFHSAKAPVKARKKRESQVLEFISRQDLTKLLCDTQRINQLFPADDLDTPYQEPIKSKLKRPALSQMAASQRAELLAERYHPIAVNTITGDVWHYTGELWDKVPDTLLYREMALIFNENNTPFSAFSIKNIIETMKLQIPAIGEPSTHLIGFKNGVYDLKTQLFRPHSQNDWLQHHNGILFTPIQTDETLASCAPNFSKWLAHAAGSDQSKVARIKAALFMVLANRYDWQLFLEVTGQGGSGKSIFTRLASLLAGEHNTASGSMTALDTARGRAQFVGKSLIILPDQVKYVGEGAGIKAVTGGDLVEIDGKYEKQFSTVLTAVVIATNNMPMTFSERNGGIARRRIIFPFDRVVKDSDKDPLLADKIANELPVIIRHLFNQFTDQEKAKGLLLEQRNSAEALSVKCETDPVIDMCGAVLFMDTATGLRMGKANDIPRNPRKFLYHLYLEYMDANGLNKPLSVQNFSKAVKAAALEYGKVYLTRQINGRTQTNVGLTDKINDFLPLACGTDE